jgi:AcrR family transcriptional regulator
MAAPAGSSVRREAALAGIGKARVYRSYPTKADLIAEITLLCLEEIDQRVERALACKNARRAFGPLVEDGL